MKEEKEIHFIINKDNIDEITQKIMNCGFKFDKIITIRDIYSDDKNFSLLKNKKGFRERIINNNEPEYTYKEMKDGKVYEENMNKNKYIKKTKNLKNKINIIKKRSIFNRGEIEVVIDDMGKIGCVLEIECKDGNPEKILEEVNLPPKLIKRTNLGCNEMAFDKIKQHKRKKVSS